VTRRLLLLALFLLLPRLALSQTVTPQLLFNTADSPAKVATYTVALQIGTGTVTATVPACAAAGTGATCTITGFTFDATKPTTFTVTEIDPATGRTAVGTLNYTPGQPPASFTLTQSWKVTIP